jgi:hypothetical protein
LIGTFEANRFCGGKNQVELHPQQKIQFEKRVKKMMDILSVKEFDKMQYVTVVYINGKLLAIDGQTRLEACKRLGIPFYYCILPITDIKQAYNLFYDLNNTGNKWTATDKTVSNCFNPNFTKEQRAEQKKIVDISNKFNLAISVVKYVAHGQDSNKQRQMTNLDVTCATDTENILRLAQDIALRSNMGVKLMKRDRFIRSVMRMYRHDSFKAKHIEILMNKNINFENIINSDHYYLAQFENVLNKGKHTDVIYFDKDCLSVKKTKVQ